MKENKRYDNERRRLTTGEYQRADGRYEYRYNVFGQSYAIYANTLEKLREREKELEEGNAIIRQKFDRLRTTINEVYELWKSLKRGLRDNTFQNYCYVYEHYAKETIGRMYMATVTKADVKRYFNYLVDELRLRVGTVESVYIVLHQVFQIAVDEEWIMKNPSDNAIKELKRSRNLESEKRIALTKKEQELLLEFLSRNNANRRWYPITVVFLETGMRVGELTGLRWCDIDFESETIDVNHTLVYYSKGDKQCEYAINDTKTKAGKRTIPMTVNVKKALLMEKMMQESEGIESTNVIDGYSDFVFINRYGNVRSYSTINKAYKRIIRDCNDEQFLKSENPKILLPQFSCHNLRHTFATRLCEAGGNIKVIQSVLGHADISTTMDLYCHVTNDMLEPARKQLNYCFGKSI